MVRSLFVSVLSMALSSCVFVVEVPTRSPTTVPPPQDRSVDIKTVVSVLPGDVKRTITETKSLPADTATVCGPFVLPAPTPVPTIGDLSDPNIDTPYQVEKILHAYIKALEEYITDERQRVVAAHDTYVSDCSS